MGAVQKVKHVINRCKRVLLKFLLKTLGLPFAMKSSAIFLSLMQFDFCFTAVVTEGAVDTTVVMEEKMVVLVWG